MVSNTLSQQFPEELTESKTTETPPCDVVLDKPVRTSAGVHQRELPPGAQPMCCAPYWLQPVRPPDYLYPVGLSVPKFVPWAPSWMVFPVFLFRVGMSLHHRERGTSPVLAARHFRTHFGIERVTVCTDHNPFVFVWCTASHRLKLLRCSLELQQYNLNIVHQAGKDNMLADLLSRCAAPAVSIAIPV